MKKKHPSILTEIIFVYKFAVDLLLCTDAAKGIYGIVLLKDKNKSTRHEFLLPFAKIGKAFKWNFTLFM
jgi:hypothetical protein